MAGLGERKLSRLGLTDSGGVERRGCPALAEPGGPPGPADRHRTHRALRDLLEPARGNASARAVPGRRALGRPRVGRRTGGAGAPARRRTGAVGGGGPRGTACPSLAAALADALREERATRLALAPLSGAGGAELVGEAAAAIYPAERRQPVLPRAARSRPRPSASDRRHLCGAFVPPAVSAAMATELAALAPPARRLLDSAAVAGDPFEPGLAAEVAELPEPEALEALDELLGSALVRQAGAPRRFAFRHPVVRHAVYEATPPGWRLGAHAPRRARAGTQGAGPVERAYHVEHAARPGDEDAIGLLAAAAGELQSPAPASRRAVPCRRPATPARPAGGSGAAQRDAAPARRCPGRLGRPGGGSRDVAGGASDRGRRRAAGPDRRASQTRSGGWAATAKRGAGSRWRSASCRRSHRRIGSGCGWRSP